MNKYPMFPDYWEVKKESDKVVYEILKTSRKSVSGNPLTLLIQANKRANNDK